MPLKGMFAQEKFVLPFPAAVDIEQPEIYFGMPLYLKIVWWVAISIMEITMGLRIIDILPFRTQNIPMFGNKEHLSNSGQFSRDLQHRDWEKILKKWRSLRKRSSQRFSRGGAQPADFRVLNH